jgi:hypothetical protein
MAKLYLLKKVWEGFIMAFRFKNISRRLVDAVTETANILGADVTPQQVEIVIEAMQVERVHKEEVFAAKQKKKQMAEAALA